MTDTPRLTSLAHGGGCGCKLAPAVLRDILSSSPLTQAWPNLLVGADTADDAAVYQLNPTQALVATTDFFTPIVDDPFDFGRIAATNALSDVYAMGATPILALAIVGMPIDKLPLAEIRQILAGGAAVCTQAGIPLAGGHSIDAAEPIYGLVALGLAHPDRILRNSTAQPGDVLVLGKGLGIGIFSAALKRGQLSPADYATMLHSTTQLNVAGPTLAVTDGVHAATDVTGFGLLGHLLEICRASRLSAELRMPAIPVLPGATALAQAGIVTGAGARNWASYGAEVTAPLDLPAWALALLCDPQTSGGLLVAVSPECVPAVIAALGPPACAIGRLLPGAPAVRISL